MPNITTNHAITYTNMTPRLNRGKIANFFYDQYDQNFSELDYE